MFVCVLGTSTAFSYWAFGVAWHAVEEFAGAVHHVHCTSIADMHAQWEKRSGRPVLFTTDVLEEKISTLILESGAPIVVADYNGNGFRRRARDSTLAFCCVHNLN